MLSHSVYEGTVTALLTFSLRNFLVSGLIYKLSYSALFTSVEGPHIIVGETSNLLSFEYFLIMTQSNAGSISSPNWS